MTRARRSGTITTCIDVRPPSPLVHHVIVRADLPHGLQVAQTIHAAGESAPRRLPAGTIAVALAARDAPHLLELGEALTRAAIPHVLVREDDGEPMSIGVEPTHDRRAVRKVLSSVPLVR